MAKRKDTTKICIHCSATPQSTTVNSILNYWKHNLGWKSPGYFAIIMNNGAIEFLAEQDDITNGAAGHNSNTVHFAYLGGVDDKNNPVDNRTPDQKKSMIRLLRALKVDYPNAEILGHCDLKNVSKACPSFSVKSWLTGYNMGQTAANKIKTK